MSTECVRQQRSPPRSFSARVEPSPCNRSTPCEPGPEWAPERPLQRHQRAALPRWLDGRATKAVAVPRRRVDVLCWNSCQRGRAAGAVRTPGRRAHRPTIAINPKSHDPKSDAAPTGEAGGKPAPQRREPRIRFLCRNAKASLAFALD